MTSFIHSLVTEMHSPTLFASAFNRGACTRHTPAESTLSQHLEHKTTSFPSRQFCWEQGRDIGQVALDPCRCQVPEERESHSASPVLAGGKRESCKTNSTLFPAPEHAKTRWSTATGRKLCCPSYWLMLCSLGVKGSWVPILPSPLLTQSLTPMPATLKVQQHWGEGTG